MVHSHRCSAEEGTSAPLLPETAEEFGMSPSILRSFYTSLWRASWPAASPPGLETAPLATVQSSAKGCANLPATLLEVSFLPPGHLHQAVYKESQEDHQGLQPSIPQTALSVALRETSRSIRSRTSRLREAFFPQAIRQMNSQNNSPYITLPLTHHASIATLPPFTGLQRTHCNNTTYLLSLDNIQCTSTTLHTYNPLHLCNNYLLHN